MILSQTSLQTKTPENQIDPIASESAHPSHSTGMRISTESLILHPAHSSESHTVLPRYAENSNIVHINHITRRRVPPQVLTFHPTQEDSIASENHIVQPNVCEEPTITHSNNLYKSP